VSKRGENISDEKTKKRERTKKNEKNEEKRKERNFFSAHFFEKTEQKASFRPKNGKFEKRKNEKTQEKRKKRKVLISFVRDVFPLCQSKKLQLVCRKI
jgi:hypothetical protein